VYVAQVERGTLRVTVDEEGETRVRQRFVVAAPMTGRVGRIPLDEGDSVKAGDVLIQIDPMPLDARTAAQARARLEAAQAAKREAEANVQKARAAEVQARRAYDRALKLVASGTISTEQLELADLEKTSREMELEAAAFGARSADFEVEAARAALIQSGWGKSGSDALVTACAGGARECFELRSPIDGRVLRVLQESERVVASGTPLLEIGDPSALEIVVDVLSSDAVKVKAGAPVLIEHWGGEGTLRARVRLIEPSGFTKVSALGVEEQRVNIVADLVDPPASLGDGYRLDARIVVWEGSDVLKIPASALFRGGKTWKVFVIESGRARLRAVEIGRRGAREVEVRAGLEAGDSLILHPSDKVEDGTRVESL
jgi:HlyD family secretion protein